MSKSHLFITLMSQLCIRTLFCRIVFNLQQSWMSRFVPAASSTKMRIIARESFNGSGRETTSHWTAENTNRLRTSWCMKRKRITTLIPCKIGPELSTQLTPYPHRLSSRNLRIVSRAIVLTITSRISSVRLTWRKTLYVWEKTLSMLTQSEISEIEDTNSRH